MVPFKIGIVGAGAIAQRNAQETNHSGVGQVVGVYDINHKVARDMAKTFAVPFYPKYEDLLNQKDLEAVLISTPHYLHKSQAIQAANAGKHILIEKPLANNLEEADEIIEAAKKNKVALTVNYSFRYLPKIQKAKDLVDQGALGEITGVQILAHQFKDPGYWTGARSNSPDDWRASREKSGGGLLIMSTCHPIDYIYYITGLKAVRTYCEYDTLNSSAEVEDIFSETFRLNNGGIGVISASSIMRGTEQVEERIWGTKGTIVIKENEIHFYSTRPVDGRKPGRLHSIKKLESTSWTSDWIRNFIIAIRDGKNLDISCREAWENLAFIVASYESLKKKIPIDIPEYKEI